MERPRDRLERVLRVRKLVRRLDSAHALGRRDEQPVVGADVQAARVVTDGQRPTWTANAGVDDREVDALGHVPEGVPEARAHPA